MALMEQALLETRQAFDAVAVDYDRSNAANPGLCQMRRRAFDALQRYVPSGARVLDLGCGPGTDEPALAAAGYRVTAIDWSPAMVAAARARVADGCLSDVEVQELGIHELDRLAPARYEAAYSNFGPLNCVPDLAAAARQIASRLEPDGVLVASVIGRICPWEMALYTWRRDRERVRVRFASGPVAVPLAGRTVWTQYYSPRQFEAAFAAAGLTRISLRSLGLVAPPPYMDAFAMRHVRLTRALHALDDRIGRWPGLRQMGDHFLIVLRRG
jgi:SAM-dependent methyltransferase